MNNIHIVVGIITKGRRELALQLASYFHTYYGHDSTVQIILIENGSSVLQQKDFEGFSKQVMFKHINEASIPKARNYIFKQVKNKNVKLAFIDDDCIPGDDWIEQIKNISFDEKVVAYTGSCISIPRKNIFAQTSQILYQLWIEANVDKLTHITSILDTKNVVFNTAA
ncbi:glycosyltransferase family 2 protein, partial [Candidatus Woesebacteria bacterium]|nr:glycosyltransferase family 2 protein [Candidatus Woesebacteria bacterium]